MTQKYIIIRDYDTEEDTLLSLVVHGPYTTEDQVSKNFGRLIQACTEEAVEAEMSINDMTNDEAREEVKNNSTVGPERYVITSNCCSIVVEVGTFGQPMAGELN
jgi:hypothetical protein